MAIASYLTVLAFDPGGSTGIAYFRCVRAWNPINKEYVYQNTEYGSLTLGPLEHHLELQNLLEAELSTAHELHLITESFEFRNKARDGLNLISREYIGIIKLFQLMPKDKIVKYTKQNPGTVMAFVQDKNIRRLGLWGPGKDKRHEMDAYRHLFWYLIHTAKIMPQQFLEIGWKE